MRDGPNGPVRVLLVEDDEDDYVLTRTLLDETALPVELAWVSSYDDAVRALEDEENEFDVCLFDVQLGERSGLDLLEMERLQSGGPPVIVLTGQRDREVDLAAMRRGATDYLYKRGLDADLLERSVRYAIERARSERALRRRSWELGERVKEQRCLYRISSALHTEEANLDAVLESIVQTIPPGWQFPAITTARIELEGRVHQVGNHAEALWTQEAGIVVEGEKLGKVAVGYVTSPPQGSRGDPFLDEERDLLEAIARRIAHAIGHRHALARLRESEARFRSLIENSSDLFTILEPDGTIRYVSPSLERIAGFHPEEKIGRAGLSEVHPEDRERVEEALAGILADPNERVHLRYRVRHADGSWRVLDTIAENRLDDPAVEGIVVNSRDITAEERARRRIEFQAELLDAVGQAVIALEPDGTIVYWNAAAERLFGWSEEDVEGASAVDVAVDRPERDEVREVIRRLAEGESWTDEFLLRRKDGTKFPALVTAEPIEDERGETTAIVGIATDVSDLRKARTKLEEREEQLRHIQKTQALGRLAGGVAHDFNNLLTAITGYGELLRESELDDAEDEYLAEILGAARRAQRLTRQLLAYSRRQATEHKDVLLNDVVRDMETMLDRLIGDDVRFCTNLATEAWPVRADPGQLEQVLLNLAVNARDAMPEGGRLEVSTRNARLSDDDARPLDIGSGEYVILTVADDGEGMDEETREQALEPFFTTKETGEGTGLGLATVYGIVRQSEGDVLIESEPGAGTQVSVLLPRARATESIEEPESNGTNGARETGSTRPRVLLVEDDPAVRKLMLGTLDRASYTVRSAANGRQALELALERHEPFDLLVTDLKMPGMGGRELVARLAEGGLETPVLFVSGYDEKIETTGNGEGQRLLEKPFTPDELLAALNEMWEPEA